MKEIDISYKMPEFKSMLVQHLDESVRPLFKEYQNAILMKDLGMMVKYDAGSDDIAIYRKNKTRQNKRYSTWQYEIGFLGYQLAKGKVSDIMIGNVMAIQFYRAQKFVNTSDTFVDNPLQLFIEGFEVAHPEEERNFAYDKCINALEDYGVDRKYIMERLNITISE